MAASRTPPPSSTSGPSLVERAAQRSMVDRQAIASAEVERIVSATYEVIQRTGSFDPTMRDILQQAGLSTQAFYRHFPSKDDLLVAILDDGQRRLVSYLEHRMAAAASPADRIRAWVSGVLNQATDKGAAARTRPFLVHQQRLADQFPAEQAATVALLSGLLVDAIRDLDPPPTDPRRDAEAIYQLTFGLMRQHVLAGSKPSRDDIAHTERFALWGLGQMPAAPRRSSR